MQVSLSEAAALAGALLVVGKRALAPQDSPPSTSRISPTLCPPAIPPRCRCGLRTPQDQESQDQVERRLWAVAWLSMDGASRIGNNTTSLCGSAPDAVPRRRKRQLVHGTGCSGGGGESVWSCFQMLSSVRRGAVATRCATALVCGFLRAGGLFQKRVLVVDNV